MKKLTICFLITALILSVIGCGDSEKAIRRKVKVLEDESAAALQKMDFKTSEEKFKQIIELDPDSQSARNNLAVLYARYMNEPKKAEALWKGLLKDTPHNSAYLNNLAGIYLSQKNYDRAIDLYNQAKEYHPNYHLPFYNIGRIYMEQKKYPEAVAELKRGLELAREDSNMIATLGQALILNGQLQEADKFLGENFQKVPQSMILSMIYSKLNRRMGNLDKSMEVLTECTNFNPLVFYLRSEQIEVALEMEKTSEEIKPMLSILETTPDAKKYPWYFDFVSARLEIRDGDLNKGLAALEALNGKISSDMIYLEANRNFWLSQAYQKTDQPEKAAIALQKAREFDPILFHQTDSTADEMVPETE